MILEQIHYAAVMQKYAEILAYYGQKTYNRDIGERTVSERCKHGYTDCSICPNRTSVPVLSEDKVNSPSHYNQSGLECIDAIKHALGPEGFIAYCKGNSIKYLWRAQHKNNSAEDLKKAAWYSRMASGDDPRDDAGYPKVPATVINPALSPLHERQQFDPTELEGYVPPECDDRPVSGRVVLPPPLTKAERRVRNK
jgi:hypothetical protein